jgi:cellulose synthase/poly-beta-1,6-N-acetylglucosamine synthase-like glycosyltransferase
MAPNLLEAFGIFFNHFFLWLNSITLYDFVLTFWPVILINFVRSVGKSFFLLLHALTWKLWPLKFDLDYSPKISLIIPAYNDEKIIVPAIKSALETNYPKKEIIIVDDGSTDRTLLRARTYVDSDFRRLPRVPRLYLFSLKYPFRSIHSMFSSDFSSGV